MEKDGLKFFKFINWLYDYSHNILSTVGGIGLSIISIYIGVESIPDLKQAHKNIIVISSICLIIIMIIGQWMSWKRAPKLLKLQTKNTELESAVANWQEKHLDFINLFLSSFANDFLQFTDQERISIYNHDVTTFVMMGRYSKNPEFNKHGRGIYPDIEGYIGAAWQRGRIMIDGLPDPQTNFDRYIEEMRRKTRIKIGTIKNLRMKSRSFDVSAIEGNRNKERIAIIVFESERANGINHDTITALLQTPEWKLFVEFLESVRNLQPSPSTVSKEGF